MWAAGPNSLLKRERFNFFLLPPFSFQPFTVFCVEVVDLLKVTWLLGACCQCCLCLCHRKWVFKSFYFCWMEKPLLRNWNGSTGICPHEWGMWQKKKNNSVNFALPSGFWDFLLIVWHDIKEGTAWTDDKQCSISLISLHKTYLIVFCGSQLWVFVQSGNSL